LKVFAFVIVHDNTQPHKNIVPVKPQSPIQRLIFIPKIQTPKGAMPMQKQTTTATTPSPTITKKIGQSVYTIQIHFRKTSKVNFNDKVMQIIKNDIARSVAAS